MVLGFVRGGYSLEGIAGRIRRPVVAGPSLQSSPRGLTPKDMQWRTLSISPTRSKMVGTWKGPPCPSAPAHDESWLASWPLRYSNQHRPVLSAAAQMETTHELQRLDRHMRAYHQLPPPTHRRLTTILHPTLIKSSCILPLRHKFQLCLAQPFSITLVSILPFSSRCQTCHLAAAFPPPVLTLQIHQGPRWKSSCPVTASRVVRQASMVVDWLACLHLASTEWPL